MVSFGVSCRCVNVLASMPPSGGVVARVDNTEILKESIDDLLKLFGKFDHKIYQASSCIISKLQNVVLEGFYELCKKYPELEEKIRMVSESWKWIGAHLGILKKTLVLNLTRIVNDLSPHPKLNPNPKKKSAFYSEKRR